VRVNAVMVQWLEGESGMYRWGAHNEFDVTALDSVPMKPVCDRRGACSCVLMMCPQPVRPIAVGDVVVRGPDWKWAAQVCLAISFCIAFARRLTRNQDGGAGKHGHVIELRRWGGVNSSSLIVDSVMVRWEGDTGTYAYRWGAQGAYDVQQTDSTADDPMVA
jgi:hypothetical protein